MIYSHFNRRDLIRFLKKKKKLLESSQITNYYRLAAQFLGHSLLFFLCYTSLSELLLCKTRNFEEREKEKIIINNSK